MPPTTHLHLNEAIQRYLTSETNYALLISGNWGSGKTYYYNNHLIDLIQQTPVLGDDVYTYTPIKISLFGKKSIQEITNDIHTQLFPLMESPTFKKGGKLFMNAAIGYLKHKTDLDLKEYLPEDLLDVKPKIKYQQIVICFDDLERASKELKHDEIIGYINSLVENDSTKVIIIANEDVIDSEEYNTIKEKTIGITVEFALAFEEIYPDLTSDKYGATSTAYHSYLLRESSFMLSILKNAKDNLRHIIFTLDVLRDVYEKTVAVKPAITPEQLRLVVLFTVSTALEFRGRRLTKKDKIKLGSTTEFSLGDLDWLSSPEIGTATVQDPAPVQQTNIMEEINEKYFYPSYRYVFFPHIFDFITLSIFLNEALLTADLENAFPEEQTLSESSQTLLALQYEHIAALSKKEYRAKTFNLIKFAKEGKYKILEVFNVFHFATRFNNPLNLDLQKLTDALIAGMNKNNENVYSVALPYQLDYRHTDPNHVYLSQLYDAAIQLNKRLEAQANQRKAAEVIALLETDIKKFGHEAGHYNTDYFYKPVFSGFKPKEFFKILKGSDYDSLSIIYYTFQNRYRKNNDLSYYHNEKPFFTALHGLLQSYLRGKNNKGPVNFQLHNILAEVTHAVNSL